MHIPIRSWLAVIACAALTVWSPAGAEPVAVVHSEGVAHGFLTVRALDGTVLGDGDLIQRARGDRVTAKLIFRLNDGSSREETTVYTQREFFRLLSNRVVQKGPAFRIPMESSIDALSGIVKVRYTDEDRQEKVIEKRLEVPEDLSNGLMLVLLKNIPRGAAKTTVSMFAMTPEPRAVKLEFTLGGEEPFAILGSMRKALRYTVKVNVPGATGAIASLLGKTPPDSRVWIVGGEAPTFLKAESSVYSGGPMWRIELASPSWPGGSSATAAKDSRRRKRAAAGRSDEARRPTAR